MPYVLFNALTGEVIRELEPDDGRAAAFILPIPPPPPPEPLPYCPPVVRPGWCEPPAQEVCAIPLAPGLPAGCECIVFDSGNTVFDGGLTTFVCPDEPGPGPGPGPGPEPEPEYAWAFVTLALMWTEPPFIERRVKVFDIKTESWSAETPESVNFQRATGVGSGVVLHWPNTASYSRVKLFDANAQQLWSIDTEQEDPPLEFRDWASAVGVDEQGRLCALLFNYDEGWVPYLRRFTADGGVEVQSQASDSWLPPDPAELNLVPVHMAVRGNVAIVPWLVYVDDEDGFFEMYLVAFDITTGTPLWNIQMDDEIWTFYGDNYAFFIPGSTDLIAVGSWGFDGIDIPTHLFRYTFPDGIENAPTLVWRDTKTDISWVPEAVVSDSRIILLTENVIFDFDPAVVAFDFDGVEVWRKDYEDWVPSIGLAGDTLAVGREIDEEGDIIPMYHFFDAATGAERSYSPQVDVWGEGLNSVGPIAAYLRLVEED